MAVAEGPPDRAPARLRGVGQPRALARSTCATGCRAAPRSANAGSASRRARSLPRWRRDTFWRAATGPAFATPRRARCARRRKAVVFFVDTFNGIFESENAIAAVRVLQAAGYTVHPRVARTAATCAAAARFSPAGMVDEARARARQLVDALLPFAARRHRHRRPRAVVPADAARRGAGAWAWATTPTRSPGRRCCSRNSSRAKRSAGRFALALQPASGPILVHGHCHQKAFGAIAPILDVLRLIPGADAEADRDLVLRHGRQLRLRGRALRRLDADGRIEPAAGRARCTDAIIVADGTSCRHQIADGAGREALHVARVLADHLVD